MKRRLLPAALAAIGLILPASGRAGTAQSTLTVTANVLGVCTIDPAALDFGDYDPIAGDRDVSGTITVHCTQGSAFWIGLDEGANPAGSARRMSNGSGELLSYELYRDAARSVPWTDGDDGQGSTVANVAGAGYAAYDVPVYGRIFGAQAVPTGAYADSVTMTVNF